MIETLFLALRTSAETETSTPVLTLSDEDIMEFADFLQTGEQQAPPAERDLDPPFGDSRESDSPLIPPLPDLLPAINTPYLKEAELTSFASEPPRDAPLRPIPSPASLERSRQAADAESSTFAQGEESAHFRAPRPAAHLAAKALIWPMPTEIPASENPAGSAVHEEPLSIDLKTAPVALPAQTKPPSAPDNSLTKTEPAVITLPRQPPPHPVLRIYHSYAPTPANKNIAISDALTLADTPDMLIEASALRDTTDQRIIVTDIPNASDKTANSQDILKSQPLSPDAKRAPPPENLALATQAFGETRALFSTYPQLPKPVAPHTRAGAGPAEVPAAISISIPPPQTSSGTTIQNIPAHTAPAPAKIVDQLVKAVHIRDDTVIELSLSPPELGRVRLLLRPEGQMVHIQMLAERPETLDLIRRSSSELLAGLLEQGFEGATFSFAQDNDTHEDLASFSDENQSSPLSELPLPSASDLMGAGLDLRL